MTTAEIGVAGLCPVNFKQFGVVNKVTKNLETTLLFSRIKFHEKFTKIQKERKKWIVRSLDEISTWLNSSDKKARRLLSALESLGLIETKLSLWYGKKRFFIRTLADIEYAPINLKILDILTEETGNTTSALIFSKIAFHNVYHSTEKEGVEWCALKKENLSNWAGISIRTLDKVIDDLTRKGLLLKKTFSSRGRAESHYNVPSFVFSSIRQRFTSKDETKDPICRDKPAKSSESIRKSTFTLNKNNNTQPTQSLSTTNAQGLKQAHQQNGDITSLSFQSKLTKRQQAYVASALNRTVARFSLAVSNPKELLSEVLFSLTNPAQGQGTQNFKHGVNRCMAIIRDKNWRTPIGYSNHSIPGAKAISSADKHYAEWERDKVAEIEGNHSKHGGINDTARKIALKIKGLFENKSPKRSDIAFEIELKQLNDALENVFVLGASRDAAYQIIKGECPND